MNNIQIETRIEPLVMQFNAVGLRTFASCQGHRGLLGGFGKITSPYVAFRTEESTKVQWLAEKLRNDQMAKHPQLFWAWEITLFLMAIYRLLTVCLYSVRIAGGQGFPEKSIDKDFHTIEHLLNELADFHHEL